QQSCEHLDRRRLAGSVRPEEAEDLRPIDIERDSIHRDLVAEALRELLDADDRILRSHESHAHFCGGDVAPPPSSLAIRTEEYDAVRPDPVSCSRRTLASRQPSLPNPRSHVPSVQFGRPW